MQIASPAKNSSTGQKKLTDKNFVDAIQTFEVPLKRNFLFQQYIVQAFLSQIA